LSVIAHEPYRVTIAPEGALHRAFQDRSQQPIELLTEGAAVDREHQRASPTFEAQRAEAQHCELTAEVVQHFLQGGVRRGIPQAVGDAAPCRRAESAPEVGNRFVPGGLAQVDQSVCGDENMVAAAINAAAHQVEAHGFRRVEASRHRWSREAGACGGPPRSAASIGRGSSKLSILVGFSVRAGPVWCKSAWPMPGDLPRFSPEIQDALAAFGMARIEAVHRLQVGLARLVLEQAPPQAASQLALALAFIERRATAAELMEARQDCWAYVGSLACGCSVADSASAHAIMTCLEADDAAHASSALPEQLERILRCGVSEPRILGVLREGVLHERNVGH
jgi:hypothetical protein